MSATKIYISGLLIFLSTVLVQAQPGSYFLNQYNPSQFGFDNNNYDLIQDEQGIMHIANRQGLLNFDGYNWWLTEAPYSLFTLVYDDHDVLYAGGRVGFGRFEIGDSSSYHFVPIDTIHRELTQGIFHKGKMYFINEKYVLQYDLESNEITSTGASDHGTIMDIQLVDSHLLISTSVDGILQLESGSLIRPVIDIHPDAYFVRESPTGTLLFLTDSSNLFYAVDSGYQKVVLPDRNFMANNTVTQIEWVSDSSLAIGTISGGISFINPFNKSIEQIIDYASGLPDNEVNAVFIDQWQGVWIAHPFGFTVAFPELPFKSFAHYQGLDGTLLYALPFDSMLFVATSVGVYRLRTFQQFEEQVSYDRIVSTVRDDKSETKQDITKRKGIFGFLKKKKSREQQPAPPPSLKNKITYKKRVTKKLVSVNYGFEKIKGISAKAIQLIVFNDQLIAGTRQGIYLVNKDTSELISPVPAQYMYGIPEQGLLFISTIDKEVRVLQQSKSEWIDTEMLDGLNDYIDQILPDGDNNIWLCGADSVYRVTLEGNVLDDVEVYNIDNPHFERLYSTLVKDRILFINSSGYYTYQDRQIIRIDSLDKLIGVPKDFVLGPDNQLWVNTGKKWYGKDGDIKSSLEFMSLISNPLSVSSDSTGQFLVITANNELYKVDGNRINELRERHGLFLKEIRGSNGKLPAKHYLSVSQENSSLTFEFITPDFTGIYNMEYQYRLLDGSGVISPWSDWSKANNVISFPFLPPGTYKLETRSQNGIGTVEEARPYEFKVVAPYWKRPWFYLFELIFFGSMLALSFYMNRGKGRYSFMSRLLGFLTLILIVEFFQTIVEYKFQSDSSPVINFFIQAFIALLILPVESLLRRLITSSQPEDTKKVISSIPEAQDQASK